MSRKDDLERNIRESYSLIREYEEAIRLSSDPKEQRRARREIEGQWGLIAGYLAEYRGLVRGALADEIAQIAHRLSTLGIELPAARERPPQVPCPYRGLEPFEAEHAACYYGREAMVTRLVEKVRDSDFVAVVGPSGCGKSSLLRAGLIATLREGALPGSEEWAVHLLRPGAAPLRSLAAPLVALLEPDAGEVDRLAEARKLADHLGEGTVTVADVAARIWQRHPALPRLLLIADQFEELYTECRDEALQQAFIAALLAATKEKRVAVILALRADFYGRVLADRRLGEAVDGRLVNVLPMGEEELRAAIEQPALRAGRAFEPGLVERILGDVIGEPGNLPLLEFALTGLWERQAADGTLTHEGYEAIGQVEGAISQRAEDAYAELEQKDQGETVRRIFLRLTHYGEGAEGTRRRAALDDLVTLRTPRQKVEPAVQALAGARLLVTGQDAATGAAVVEVAHEALIRGWKRLRRWLDEDRAFGLWREKLAAARHMWEEVGQDAGALLRSAPLAEAEGWLGERGEDLNEAERTFVQQSLALRKRRRLRQWIATAALVTIAMLIATIMTVQRNESVSARRTAAAEANVRAMAVISAQERQLEAEEAQVTAQAANTQAVEQRDEAERQRQIAHDQEATAVAERDVAATARAEAEAQRDEAQRQSRRALAGRLAAQSLSYLDRQLDLGLLLSVEAYYAADIFQSRDSLLTALEYSPHLARFLHGHTGWVSSLVFSPDGKTLASGSGDTTIRLWDTATGQPLGQPLAGHTTYVESVVFSPDGRSLASGSGDHTIILWDVATGQPLGQPLTGHTNPVRNLAFSPDGKTLASGSCRKLEDWRCTQGEIRLWDTAIGQSLGQPLTGHTDRVSSVAFSPNGKTLASGGWDGTIHLWDISTILKTGVGTAQPIGHPLKYCPMGVESMTFSPDGKTLTSRSRDTTTVLWDLTTSQPIDRFRPSHSGQWSSMAFSPDGKVLALESGDDTIRLWDVVTDQPLGQPLNCCPMGVESMTFSPDGKTLASSSWGGTIHLWNISTVLDTGVGVAQPFIGHTADVWSVAFSPNGKTLASGSGDSTIRLWDVSTVLNTGVGTAQPAGRSLVGHTDDVFSVAFSADGKTLASGSWDNTVRLWDAATGQPIGQPLTGHTDSVLRVAFSPDGKTLASGSSDNTVRLWDVATGQPIGQPLTSHAASAYGVAFSPDGKTLAAGSVDTTIRLWDVSTVLDTGMGAAQPVGQPLAGHIIWVSSVAFSPDGKTLVSSSGDDTIRLWDVATGQPIGQPFSGHTSDVTSVAFSPDGKTLASGSVDHTIRLWDVAPVIDAGVAGGQPLGPPLTSHTEVVWSVAFSPDGKTLASGSMDTTIRLWSMDPTSWQARACRVANRNLTYAEWQQFLPGQAYRKTCPDLPGPEGEGDFLSITPSPTPSPTPTLVPPPVPSPTPSQ